MNIHWKDWCCVWNSNTFPPNAKNWLIGEDPDAGKDLRWEEKGTTEDEVVWWHHQPNRREFDQAPEVGMDREAWCALVLVVAESDMTEWLNFPCLFFLCHIINVFKILLSDPIYHLSPTSTYIIFFFCFIDHYIPFILEHYQIVNI